MTAHTLTLIIGNVASGKSTLAKRLALATHAKPVMADELFKTNPFFPLVLEDRKRWSFASDTWFLQARYEDMQRTARLLSKHSLIVDSGIYMSYAHAYSKRQMQYFTPDEWTLYRKMCKLYFSETIKPVEVIYLQSSLPTLLTRIAGRGRDYEKKFSREYLASIERGLAKLAILLKQQHVPITKYNTDKLSLADIIRARLGNHPI